MLIRPSHLSPSTLTIPTPTSFLKSLLPSLPSRRAFSILPTSQRSHTNRIFDPIRTPNDLHTLTMLNAADNRTLITLWSAKWCQTCQTVKPLIVKMLEEEKVGQREGGLGFAEVEMDSTLIADLPVTYRVRFRFSFLKFTHFLAAFFVVNTSIRFSKPNFPTSRLLSPKISYPLLSLRFPIRTCMDYTCTRLPTLASYLPSHCRD
ncbi:hypothetical protein BKA63DRAFT_527134 [Paraphoma chrysanthemicola]|nr:hypothetical protein BKA63DRAFT_527134 [Paraphoma chrysanthemicola]